MTPDGPQLACCPALMVMGWSQAVDLGLKASSACSAYSSANGMRQAKHTITQPGAWWDVDEQSHS